MEIHHQHHHDHPQHKEKVWKHYALEFFMLFLAVFCGFLAENFREHQIEHQREKEYMISLVEDLNEDIETLNHQIVTEGRKLLQMDSLINFLNNKPNPDQLGRIYYIARMASRHDIFNYNNRTIDQMRNSGAFRLVRNKEISSQIVEYYRQIKLLEMLEGIEKEEEHEYRRGAIKVFDPVVFNVIVSNEKDSVTVPVGNPPLRTQDHNVLADLAGWTQYVKSSVLGMTKYKTELKKSAEELTSSIKKAYHLE